MPKVIGNETRVPRDTAKGISVDIQALQGSDMGGSLSLPTNLRGVTAAALQVDNQTYYAVTLATANIDQAAPSTAPAWARYLAAYCSNAFKVAFGAATTASVGHYIPGGQYLLFPFVAGGDSLVHAQSDTTLSTLWLSYLANG